MNLKCFLLAAVVLGASQLGMASTITSFIPVGSPVTLGGTNYQVYDLNITTSTTWLNADFNLSLTQGSIFNVPAAQFGTNTPPNPALIAAFPAYNLQDDTFFTTPGGPPNVAFPGVVPSFAGDAETATSLSTSWFAPGGTTNAAGTYTIAQITLSTDAKGTFSGDNFDTSALGQPQTFSGSIGAVPEPASLGVFSLGALSLLLRKRKSA